jgi:leucyl-tRNA synthetase
MGKSLKNSVTPDDLHDLYGADTMRLYEMSMGPLEQSRPWETRAVVGMYRFLQRVWRNLVDEETGETRVVDGPADDQTRRLLHRTIAAVRADMDGLRFNTAIAKLIELNNELVGQELPREVAEALVLMLAPLTPHVAEELWARLGHDRSLAYETFPVPDPALLVDDTQEYPVQVNGKVRAHVVVATGADAATVEAAALADAKVVAALGERPPKRVVVVPGRLVNVVV